MLSTIIASMLITESLPYTDDRSIIADDRRILKVNKYAFYAGIVFRNISFFCGIDDNSGPVLII